MAYIPTTVQVIALTGLTPSYGAVDAGLQHSFINDGNTFLHVKNTNASTRTVTITPVGKAGNFTLAPQVITIPANTGDLMIGPFDPTVCNQVGGVVYADFSAAAGVTLAAVRLP